MESDQPETGNPNPQALALLLKEFLFLKFKLRGDALVQDVESEKWQSQIKAHSVSQLLEALSLLQTQTKQSFMEALAEKQLEGIQLEVEIEEEKIKIEEVKIDEMKIKKVEKEKEEMKVEEMNIEIKRNKDSTNFYDSEGVEKISVTRPPLPQIVYSDSSSSSSEPDRIPGKEERVREDWFKLCKAAAIFPYECDPPDGFRLVLHFEYKHIHIQLAHASRLGLWRAHSYVRQLGRDYALDVDHPICRNFRAMDTVLKSDYMKFEICSGGFKYKPVLFKDSNDVEENYADVDEMTYEEKDQYMRKIYLI